MISMLTRVIEKQLSPQLAPVHYRSCFRALADLKGPCTQNSEVNPVVNAWITLSEQEFKGCVPDKR